jgi:hypothetical protein
MYRRRQASQPHISVPPRIVGIENVEGKCPLNEKGEFDFLTDVFPCFSWRDRREPVTTADAAGGTRYNVAVFLATFVPLKTSSSSVDFR